MALLVIVPFFAASDAQAQKQVTEALITNGTGDAINNNLYDPKYAVQYKPPGLQQFFKEEPSRVTVAPSTLTVMATGSCGSGNSSNLKDLSTSPYQGNNSFFDPGVVIKFDQCLGGDGTAAIPLEGLQVSLDARVGQKVAALLGLRAGAVRSVRTLPAKDKAKVTFDPGGPGSLAKVSVRKLRNGKPSLKVKRFKTERFGAQRSTARSQLPHLGADISPGRVVDRTIDRKKNRIPSWIRVALIVLEPPSGDTASLNYFFDHGTYAQLTPSSRTERYDCRGGSPYDEASLVQSFTPDSSTADQTRCNGDGEHFEGDTNDPYKRAAKLLPRAGQQAKRLAKVRRAVSGQVTSATITRSGKRRGRATIQFADSGPGSISTIVLKKKKSTVSYYEGS